MIAQGERSEALGNSSKCAGFFRHSPPAEANDEKSKRSREPQGIASDLFYNPPIDTHAINAREGGQKRAMKTATNQSGSAVGNRSHHHRPLTTPFITLFFIIKKQCESH